MMQSQMKTPAFQSGGLKRWDSTHVFNTNRRGNNIGRYLTASYSTSITSSASQTTHLHHALLVAKAINREEHLTTFRKVKDGSTKIGLGPSFFMAHHHTLGSSP